MGSCRLRFPDGRICENSAQGSCLQAAGEVIGVKDTHTLPQQRVSIWSLNESGQLQLDGTTGCLSVSIDQAVVVRMQPCSEHATTVLFAHPHGEFLSVATPEEYLFNFSVANRETGFVHLFGQVNLLGDAYKGQAAYNYTVFTSNMSWVMDAERDRGAAKELDPHKPRVSCVFRHQNQTSEQPLVFGTVHTFAQRWTSTMVLCLLPEAISTTVDQYIPGIRIDGRIVFGLHTVRLLPPTRAPRHKFCLCISIWQHWEYLFEHLLYHTTIHGLGHTIVIAQDHVTGKAARWLGTFFSLEVVYWPHVASQPSMNAYCAALAKPQCEWVGSWDVDEFLHIPTPIPQLLSTERASKVGGFVLHEARVQMPAGQVVLRTLPGGVIRNYLCRLSQPEKKKTLVSLDRSHPLFVNSVHSFTQIKGHGHARLPFPKYSLLHYRYQSWELFRIRHLRNIAFHPESIPKGGGAASFGGSLADYPIDKPDAEYCAFLFECVSWAHQLI